MEKNWAKLNSFGRTFRSALGEDTLTVDQLVTMCAIMKLPVAYANLQAKCHRSKWR